LRRPFRRPPRLGGPAGLVLLAVVGVAGLSGLSRTTDSVPRSAFVEAAPVEQTFAATNQDAGSCDIKGNISVETGERIYHVPGQKYYAKTRISEGKGERWFCSEAEARAAGWRRSKV
jgi:hypothetical protein